MCWTLRNICSFLFSCRHRYIFKMAQPGPQVHRNTFKSGASIIFNQSPRRIIFICDKNKYLPDTARDESRKLFLSAILLMFYVSELVLSRRS